MIKVIELIIRIKAGVRLYKYNEALNALENLKKEIATIEWEYKKLKKVDREFRQALDNKLEFLKCSNTEEGRLVIECENKIYKHDRMIKEYTEAIHACERAKATSIRAYKCLDEAQRFMTMLQIDLSRLKTELLDIKVSMDTNIGVRISDELKIADFFFDGLFADLSVKGRIKHSMDKIINIQNNIMDIVAEVSYKRAKEIEQREVCQKKLDEIVIG